MGASVTINRSRLQRLLSAVGGPGDRLLRAKAERVAALARVYSASHGSIPEGIIVQPDGPGRYKVISTNPHTMLIINGSRPHKIRPRRRGGWLRFEVDGRIVYAREVNHPGYRGDDFLSKALRDA
ncbi:hypothetical protein SEA_MISCHIEF19_27 [Streptomyces phage Mischief19]|nr:hypothetical protein SEA_MISCHIEF19_27 [Streptomyces phage Mischief19]